MAWPNTVRESDLRIEYYRGSGAGGQNRNKRDTACRITHILTGISATAEDERSQHQNKKIAFRRLAAKLVPLMKQALEPERPALNTERIRTYHEPRQTVKDTRVEGKTWNYDDIMNGELEEMIAAVQQSVAEKETK